MDFWQGRGGEGGGGHRQIGPLGESPALSKVGKSDDEGGGGRGVPVLTNCRKDQNTTLNSDREWEQQATSSALATPF